MKSAVLEHRYSMKVMRIIFGVVVFGETFLPVVIEQYLDDFPRPSVADFPPEFYRYAREDDDDGQRIPS